jgi:hypothetical protein
MKTGIPKFIKKILLFSMLILLLLGFGISRVTIGWQGDYMYALIDKFDRLKTENSPKMVLIGGSNLAFGMDSQTISEYYDMPVVNMGLHAGVGLKFLLEGITPYIKKNDLVVIIPEYGHFYDLYLGNGANLVNALFNVYPQGFRLLNLQQWFMILSEIPRYSIDNLQSAYISGHAFKKYEHKIYARNSFNCYGDVTAHWASSSYIKYQFKNSKVRKIDKKMLKDLEKHVLFFQSQGVEVVILPPAIVNTVAQSIHGEIQQVTEALAQNSNRAYRYFYPERYSLPDSLGYDTRYHFLKPGIDIRVQYIIEDLNLFLEENQVVK